MHSMFPFSARQILWTLTFASQLVLLVVLLGRDRARRYPWFTVSIALFAFRLLIEDLLDGRMANLPFQEILLGLADLGVIVGLVVVVEAARRSFAGARRLTWLAGAFATVALAAAALVFWFPWAQWKTIQWGTLLGTLRIMQFGAQAADIFVDLLTVELGLLVVLLGRQFRSGWRSHTQKLVIGLSTVSLARLVVQVTGTLLSGAQVHSRAEYERLVSLWGRMLNANKVVFLVALIWWIVWLWMDEPAGITASSGVPQTLSDAALDTPQAVE